MHGPSQWIILLSVAVLVMSIILQFRKVTMHYRERDDFRHAITSETLTILKQLNGDKPWLDLTFADWFSKTSDSRTEILGKKDHSLLNEFYGRAQDRANYLDMIHGYDWESLMSLNRKCVVAFSKMYGELTWLKSSTEMQDTLSKAEKKYPL